MMEADVLPVPASSPPLAKPLLELTLSGKAIGGRQIIGAVQLALEHGEILAIVGPSGCGKSTLLRILAGLDTDYQGRVRVASVAPAPGLADVGFVFQEPRLLPWLTVAQNVGFDARARDGRHPRVAELLAEVGLTEFADAWPKALSGGMAQRAAIARGLFRQPRLLLLDEPFSAVDAFTRKRLQDLLLGIVSRHRTSLVIVTHDIDEAVYLADRVVVLSAPPARVLAQIPVPWPHPREREDARQPQFARRVLDAF